jgi:hypothetical protein
MKASRLGNASLSISHALLFAVWITFLLFANGHFVWRGEELEWMQFVFLFAIAFLWEVFTVYHHRRAYLAWVLLIIYGTTATLFLIFGWR